MIVAGSADAHHSTAMYDYSKDVVLTGTVRRLLWTNPHSYLQLLIPNAAGGSTEWSIEIGTPALNSRGGWTKNSVKPGDKVKVSIGPLKDGTAGGTLKKATLADGRVLNGAGADFKINPPGAPGP